MKTIGSHAAALLFALVLAQEAAAITNYVVSLHSSTDYVRIPDSDSLDFTTNFTLEAWINPAQISGQIAAVVAKRRSLNGDGYNLSVVREEAVFGMNDDPGDALPIHNFGIGSPNLIKAGKWQHIAGTYDGQTARLYVDGKLANSAATARKLLNSSQPLLIGQLGLPGDARPFIGQIDEVRVWNRALSQPEIQLQMSVRLTGHEPGLVGYWNFDTSIANDKSGFANHGQIIGQAKLVEGFMVLRKSPAPALLTGRLSRLNGYRFTLEGAVGATYQIETSTDWLQWSPLISVKLSSESLEFTDVSATNFPSFRFYRARQVP